MDLNVDQRHTVNETVGSWEPPLRRPVALVVVEEASLVGPGRPQYSYLAECECPDDCLRDHGNE